MPTISEALWRFWNWVVTDRLLQPTSALLKDDEIEIVILDIEQLSDTDNAFDLTSVLCGPKERLLFDALRADLASLYSSKDRFLWPPEENENEVEIVILKIEKLSDADSIGDLPWRF